VVTLAQNYRSTQQVLDVANALMRGAAAATASTCSRSAVKARGPRVVTVDELQSQAEYVCTEVLQAPRGERAAQAPGGAVRSAEPQRHPGKWSWRKRKVPFVKYGGPQVSRAAPIKDLLAVLRWADQPAQHPAAFRALQLLPGMGPVNARNRDPSGWRPQHTRFEALKAFSPRRPRRFDWRRLIELMQALADPQRPWPGQLHLAREWYRPHFERLYEQFHTRLGDLEQLEVLSGQYRRANASSPSSHSIRRTPPVTSPVARRSMRTTWYCRRSTRRKAWSGTPSTC